MTARPAALERRVAEFERVAAAHGWTTRVERHRVESWHHGTFLAAARDEWVLTLCLAVRPGSRRVSTLEALDYHGARVVLHLEDGSGSYWYSRRADSWRFALANPERWSGTAAS